MSAAGAPALPLIQVACGVLVDAGGRVLMAQRPKGKIAAGYWEFPGGKIEPGEAAEAAPKMQAWLGVKAVASVLGTDLIPIAF